MTNLLGRLRQDKGSDMAALTGRCMFRGPGDCHLVHRHRGFLACWALTGLKD